MESTNPIHRPCKKSDPKLGWLQVGRFLAAFWVLLHHGEGQIFNGAFGQGHLWRTYGMLGVDFFFCLSGFIIIFRCWESFGNAASAGQFLQRRIVRIFPLIWLLMLVQISASITIGNTTTPTDWSTLLYDALLLPSNREHTVNVAWTLRYEMFFYCVTTLLLLFRAKVALLLGSCWLLCVLLANLHSHDSNIVEEYFFGNWNILFLTGVLVAYAYQSKHKKASNWICIGFLVSCFGTFLFISGSYPNHHTSENLPRMLSSALMFGGMLTVLIGLDLKGIRPPTLLVSLGDASFSIYLIHSTVLSQLRSNLHGSALQIASVAAIPLILGVSLLLFRYFERPSGPFFRKLFFGATSASSRQQ